MVILSEITEREMR